MTTGGRKARTVKLALGYRRILTARQTEKNQKN